MVMDIKEIMEIIPHRQPFLLIDRIEELEPGKRAVGKKCVTYNEPFFNGHFPQEPVMPGVLILEALAQTGAVAILSQPENKGKTVYFGGIDKAKFKRKVVPGDVLTLELGNCEAERTHRCGYRKGDGRWKIGRLRRDDICGRLKKGGNVPPFFIPAIVIDLHNFVFGSQ